MVTKVAASVECIMEDEVQQALKTAEMDKILGIDGLPYKVY